MHCSKQIRARSEILCDTQRNLPAGLREENSRRLAEILAAAKAAAHLSSNSLRRTDAKMPGAAFDLCERLKFMGYLK